MVTIDDLTVGRRLPGPMVVTVKEVDWNPGKSRRAEVTILDSAGNSLRLIDYEGAENSTNWTKNHQYRISDCKVQQGGGRFDIELAPGKQTQIEPLGTIQEGTQILVVGDTHVGRTEHPKTGNEIDPIEPFSKAIDYAIGEQVDAVVHVGDIFHESATATQARRVATSVFDPLSEASIPFYYIRGNHSAPAGDRLLNERAGALVSSLNTSTRAVGSDVRLFGLDHDPAGELAWKDLPSPASYDESSSLLLLHQGLVRHSTRDTTAAEFGKIQQKFGGEFDAIIVGHQHDADLKEWDNVSVLFTGAAEQMSTNTDPNDRVVWLLTVKANSLIWEPYNIPQN